MAPTPPRTPPRTGGGLAARLTRKVGPLPVWAWAAVILGAYLLYSRVAGAKPAADTTGVPATGRGASAQVPASGQGSSADNMSGVLLDQLGANTSSIDALTSQLLSMPTPYSHFGDAPAAGTPPPSAPGGVTENTPAAPPASQPTTPPVTTTQAGAPPAHQTQTQAGVLSWGGVTFTTRDAFDRWAAAHGSTTNKELANHPQARALYSTLR